MTFKKITGFIKGKNIIKIIILIILILLISFLTFYVSFSRYKNTATTDTTLNVAKWNIAFKNDNGQELSLTNPVEFKSEGSSYVAENKIAPTTNVSARFILDATGSEMAIDYYVSILKDDLKFGDEQNLIIDKITAKIKNKTESDLDFDLVKENNVDIYKSSLGFISLNDIESNNNEVEINIKLKWENAEDLEIYEYQDIIVPITIYAKQHIELSPSLFN